MSAGMNKCGQCGVELWVDDEYPGVKICGCSNLSHLFLDNGVKTFRKRLIALGKRGQATTVESLRAREDVPDFVRCEIEQLLSRLYNDEKCQSCPGVASLIKMIEAALGMFAERHPRCKTCNRPYDRETSRI